MASAGAIAEAVQEFTNIFKGLCLNPKWSDIDVVCGNVIFPAHKIIVCAQSRHFASGCGYNSWADHFRAALVPDDHPLCVKLMLHFLYQGDYPHVEDPSDLGLKRLSTHSRDPSAPIEVTSVVVDTQQLGRQNSASNKSPVGPPVRRKHLFVEGDEGNKSGKAHDIEGGTPPRPTPNLALHARMYAIGDKFGIPPLKGLAQAKFMDELGESWDTDDFLDAIEVVFTSEPFDDRGLRDVVMQKVWAHPLLVAKPKAKEIIKRLNMTLVFPRV